MGGRERKRGREGGGREKERDNWVMHYKPLLMLSLPYYSDHFTVT